MNTVDDDEPSVITPEVLDQHDPEHQRIMERRWRVLSLKLSGMVQPQIAQVIKVNQSTVSRDLTWIKENWKKEYGLPSIVSPAEEIGEARDLFRHAEELALRAFHREVGNTRASMACLRTAMIARGARLTLLQDVGLLERQLGNLNVNPTLRADGIRTWLRDEGILSEAKATGRARLTEGDTSDDDGPDDIDRWLDRD